MVDLSEIQAAYYMVAATGVLVAAAYYIVNLRETTKNRRATFENNFWQSMQTPEYNQLYIDVISMRWNDFEDFKRKYDSTVNPENWARRSWLFLTFDSLGRQLRKGFIDVDSFSDNTAAACVIVWHRFKAIIEGYRGWEMPKGWLRDFEYLAGVLERRLMYEDPEYMRKLNNVFVAREAIHTQ